VWWKCLLLQQRQQWCRCSWLQQGMAQVQLLAREWVATGVLLKVRC
jgi:hypothetical protein